MKRLALLAALAFAAPAAYAADQTSTTVAMSDAQLDDVSAGGQQHKMKWKKCKTNQGNHNGQHKSGQNGGTLGFANNNINVSPTIIVQHSTAITNQVAIGNKGPVTQTATTLALNSASVNYSVLQK